MLDALKPEDLRAILGKMVEAAKEGDVAAARLVLAYGVGKPAPAVDPDTLDIQEWQQWQQLPVLPEVLQALMGPLQVPIANFIARTLSPISQVSFGKEIASQIEAAFPPQPGAPSAQAQGPAPVVPRDQPGQAGPAPAAGLASASGRVAAKGAPAQARKEQRPQTSAEQETEKPDRPPERGFNEAAADSPARLAQLLALCQQLLGPAPPTEANPTQENPSGNLEALLRP